jgi:hypothetical protein
MENNWYYFMMLENQNYPRKYYLDLAQVQILFHFKEKLYFKLALS